MDMFHDNPVLQGVRQMLGAFARQMMRPIAIQHDRDESMPWALMKAAQAVGMSQTAVLDGRKRLTGVDEDPDPGKPQAELRRLLQGDDAHGHIKIAAMALSEPGTGSDISGLNTTARADGDHFIVRGSKQWITNGQSASAYLVWAQTDPAAGRGGVRAFLIARDTPGLVPGRKETKLGIRASETAQVHFEDVRVHKDLMLGGAHAGTGTAGGLSDTKKMLDSTRPAVGAQAVGIARAAYEFLLDRVRASSLHGTPMASHQHIMFELADMHMEIAASRLLVHRAAWMADHQLENVADASAAKAHAARTAQLVTQRAMVLIGDEALEPGHPVEKWYRDAKIYDIFEGTGQIQRRMISRHLTGQNPT